MKQTDCEGCTKKNVHCWKNHELQKWLCKGCKEKPSAVKSGAGTPVKGSPTKGESTSTAGGKKSPEVLLACAMRSLHDIYGLDCDPLVSLEEVMDDLMDRFDFTEDQAQDAVDVLSDKGYIESAKGKRERSGEKKKSPVKKGKKGVEEDEDSAFQYSGPLLMYSLLGVLQAIRASGRGPVKHEDRPFHGGFIGHALRIKLPYRPKDILYMTTELGTKTGMLTLKAPVYSWGSVEPTNLPDDLKEVERLLAIGEANIATEEGALFSATTEKPVEKKPATPATGTTPSYAAAAGARPATADALTIMEGALKDKELAKLFISIITENHCEGAKKSKEVRPLLRSHLQNELFLSKNTRVSKDGAIRAKIINAAVDNELLVFDEVLKGGEVRYKFGPAWTGVSNTASSSERSTPVPESKTPVKKADKMKLEEAVTSKAEANELADLLVKLIHKFHLPPTSRPMLRSHLHNELNESGNKLMRNSALRSEVIELALKTEIIVIAKKHPSEILYGLGPNFARKDTGKGKEKGTPTKGGHSDNGLPTLPRRVAFRDKHLEAVLNCIEQKWGIENDPPIRRHLLAAELQKKYDLDKSERDAAVEAAIKKGMIKEVDESTKEHLQYQLHGEMADRMYLSGILSIMKENEDNSHFRQPQSVEGVNILLKQLKQKYIYRPELECILAVEKAMEEGWLDRAATEKVLKKERAAAGLSNEKSALPTKGDEEYEKEKADAASPYVDSRAAFMDRYAIDKTAEEPVEVKIPAVKPLFGLGAEIEANKNAECDICQQVPEGGESVKKCRCPECVEAISQMSPGGAGADSNTNKGLKLCSPCFEYIHPNGAPAGYVSQDLNEPTNPAELIVFLRAKLERTEDALHGKIRRLEQENGELRSRLERSERARKEPDPHLRMVDDLVGLGGDLGLNGLSVAAKPFTPTKAMPPTPPTATTPTAAAPMTVSAVPSSTQSVWGNGTTGSGTSTWQNTGATIPQQQQTVGIPNPAAALYQQQAASRSSTTQQSPTTASPVTALPSNNTNGTAAASSSSSTTWAAIGNGTALSTPWSTTNSVW